MPQVFIPISSSLRTISLRRCPCRASINLLLWGFGYRSTSWRPWVGPSGFLDVMSRLRCQMSSELGKLLPLFFKVSESLRGAMVRIKVFIPRGLLHWLSRWWKLLWLLWRLQGPQIRFFFILRCCNRMPWLLFMFLVLVAASVERVSLRGAWRSVLFKYSSIR